MTVPSVAYTDPEIAWMGLTEREADKKGIPYEKSVFPWNASGRALTMGRPDGMTKLLWSRQDGRLLGAAIAGTNASELLSEMTLALEMGANLEDISLTMYPPVAFGNGSVCLGSRVGHDYRFVSFRKKKMGNMKITVLSRSGFSGVFIQETPVPGRKRCRQ